MSGQCQSNLSEIDISYRIATALLPHPLENFKTTRSSIFEGKEKAARLQITLSQRYRQRIQAVLHRMLAAFAYVVLQIEHDQVA